MILHHIQYTLLLFVYYLRKSRSNNVDYIVLQVGKLQVITPQGPTVRSNFIDIHSIMCQ